MAFLFYRIGIYSGISLALLLLCLALPAHARKQRNVLVLHSYHQGLQWTDNISAGIKKEFQDYGDDIEIYFEYLDTKRIPGEEYINHMIRFERYKNKLSHINFEVIISSDNTALRLIVKDEDKLWPGVPVVFCGVNNFNPAMLNGKKNITGVAEAIDYRSTLNLIEKLHPDRKNILVILDKTPTGEAIKHEFNSVEADFSDHFHFEYYQNFILSEVSDKIKTLGANDIIYLLTFNRDRQGTFISYVDGIHMIKQASSVPIYGSWDFYFGHGIVGGMITSGVSQGEQAAKLAKQILEGKSADQIPYIAKSPNRFMFDFNEMQRFGIDPSDLPKGSKIIHLPPSFIDQHKRGIAVSSGMILVLALILAWRLFIQKQRQHALIESNIELDRRVAEQTHILEMQNRNLEREIKDRIQIEKILVDKKDRLEEALSKVKTLRGLLPICSSCKKIRDDKGYWNQIESYVDQHSDATFSHGICPSCARNLYPELFDEDELDNE